MTYATRTLTTFQIAETSALKPAELADDLSVLGEDVCKWIIAELVMDGVRCDAQPSQESYGWCLNFSIGDEKYCLVCGFRPGDSQDPAVWIVWIERSVGFFGGIFGAGKKGIDMAAPFLINKVLAKNPDISNIRWHLKKDFDCGNEEAGQSSPS